MVQKKENAVKPRLENINTYNKGELDELEKEGPFHLKKIQGYKKREIERTLAASRLFAEEHVAEKVCLQKGILVNPTHNLISALADKDEDIIFCFEDVIFNFLYIYIPRRCGWIKLVVGFVCLSLFRL